MSKQITDTMHHIGNGFFISTASDKFQELVKKVNESGKAGKIDLTINVKKIIKSGVMEITGRVKATMPADEPMQTVLFATEEGVLTPDNPKQHRLDLKVVEDQKLPLKTLEGTN